MSVPAPVLTEDQVAHVVREAALAYYTPEELALQLGLDPPFMRRILARPEIARAVAARKRELTESGDRFVLTAKQAATESVQEVLTIALDATQSTGDRLKAIECLAKWSGLARTDEDKGQINIVIHGADGIERLREANPWGKMPASADSAPHDAAPAAFHPVTVEFDVPEEVTP